MLPGSRDHEESTNKPRVRPPSIYCIRREREREASHGSALSHGHGSARLLISPDEQSLIVSVPRDCPPSARSSVFCTSDGHLRGRALYISRNRHELTGSRLHCT